MGLHVMFGAKDLHSCAFCTWADRLLCVNKDVLIMQLCAHQHIYVCFHFFRLWHFI